MSKKPELKKEWILNSIMNRFQLNQEKNVGPTSLSIRLCSPKSIEEWEKYYFNKVKSKEHIIELGKKLYIKISEVVPAEVASISEEDCINYMINMVTARTYDGYRTEIDTIYGQLQHFLDVKIEPAPDKWDRLYNVDFFIQVKEYYIGLQIKPSTNSIQQPQIHKEYILQAETHEKFTKEFGGKVFYIYSIKRNRKKEISNLDVIDDIVEEIERLSEL